MGKMMSIRLLDNVQRNYAGWRERPIQPTKSYKFNVLQFIGRPDKRSASGNLTLVISPHAHNLIDVVVVNWRPNRQLAA